MEKKKQKLKGNIRKLMERIRPKTKKAKAIHKKELPFGVCKGCGEYTELIPTGKPFLCENCVRVRDGRRKRASNDYIQ
ncbi:MAG: hypothetical protein ISS93_03520 [Candidatus Aenigmarchaeota archaeon]|nr:hypothetical protein [Candidatus Aenigmarchaeota archaeon]